jgi:hypothetical protein
VTDTAAHPELRIIGIDCATDAKNVGLALCTFTDGRPRIEEVTIGKTWSAIEEQVASCTGLQPARFHHCDDRRRRADYAGLPVEEGTRSASAHFEPR